MNSDIRSFYVIGDGPLAEPNDEHAVAPDFLTLLKSLDKPLCKRFTLRDGKTVGLKPEFAFRFSANEVVVNSLEDLAKVLLDHEQDRQCCVIAGKLADDVAAECVRRRKENFEPAAHRWIMLDIDRLALPDGVNPDPENTDAILRVATSALPAEFHGVDCYYQFSGSMGIKSGIRVHLWFWLSRSVTDDEKKAWLAETPVDLAVFDPIQVHFTAAPIFEDGIIDPFPDRSGVFRQGRNLAEVVVPSDLAIKNMKMRRRGAADGMGGGPHEVIRDPETGLAIDGREALMFQLSNEVMFDLCRGGNEPDVQEITDQLWERFQEQADISRVNDRGPWTRADAEEKARRRYEEKSSGEFSFQARDKAIALFPAESSPYETEVVGAVEGQRLLDAALNRFFSDVDEQKTPRDLIRITMGSGKTKGTIRKLKEYLADRSGQLIEVYVPRHDIIEEWKNSLESEDDAPVNADVVHIKPRTGGTPNAGSTELPFLPLCDRADYVRDLEIKGYPVFGTACLNEEAGEQCEFYGTCRYLEQFRISGTDEVASSNVIRLYTHAHLGLPRNEDERQRLPDLVVIDENPLSTLVAPDSFPEIQIAQIASYISTDRVPRLGGELVSDFYSPDGLGWLKRLRFHGISNGQLEAIGRKILPETVPFERSRKSASNVPDAHHVRGMRALLQVLREELRFKNRARPERIVPTLDKSGVVVCLAKECRITDQEPLLILDATATPVVAEKLFGPLRESRISIQQKAFVTQVYDRTGSNTSWNRKVERQDSYEDVATLIDVLRGWVDYGSRPLVVSHKKLADLLRHELGNSSGVAVAHFQALRGSNEYEECDVVFITGRNAPPYTVVDQQGRALFWDDATPLFHDDISVRLPSKQVSYWQRKDLEGPQSGVFVDDFTDPRLSALNEQFRHAETAQAIARLRLVWASYRKRVFLLGNLPVEMPIDRLVGFDDLMPDKLERELLAKGDLPLTPGGMVRMRPDLFGSENAARQAINRSTVKTPQRLLSAMPELARASLMVATFRPQGSSIDHKHLFLNREFEIADKVMTWCSDQQAVLQHLQAGWGEGTVQQLRLELLDMGGTVHRPTRGEIDEFAAAAGDGARAHTNL